MEGKGKKKIYTEGEGGGIILYGGQFRMSAIRRCFFRVFLKETRDLHVLMTVGREFTFWCHSSCCESGLG